MSLETEIYSIEAANINKETLDAMKNASSAMKQIHGGLTIDKVDQTMWDTPFPISSLTSGGIANFFEQGGASRTTRYWRRDRRGNHTIDW